MKKREVKLSDTENKTRKPGMHSGSKSPGQIKKGPKPSQIRYVGDAPLL
jgi:hypothetical protein